jgi:hypothetical protein
MPILPIINFSIIHDTVAGSAVQSFAERGQERLLDPGQ